MQQHSASDINDNEDTTDACLIPCSQGSFVVNYDL